MAFPSDPRQTTRQTRNHRIAALELADKCTTNAPQPALPLLYCARVRAPSRRSKEKNRIQKAKIKKKIREDDPSKPDERQRQKSLEEEI
jgi:hypothetical protein